MAKIISQELRLKEIDETRNYFISKIVSSAVEINICTIPAIITKFKSMINKKRKKEHNEIVFLEKAKLSTVKVLISRSLTDSCISHEQFF